MKKMISLAVAVVMTAGLIGCGSKPAESTTPAPAESAATVVNPWSECTQEKIMEKTGLALIAPEDAKDVGYTLMDNGQEQLAEMQFVREDVHFFLRAQVASQTETYDMSGLYYEFDYEDTEPVGYCEGHIKLSPEGGCIYWQDVVPGINYTLGCTDFVTIEQIAKTAEDCFIQVSADSFTPIWTSMDYSGVWSAEDGSTISFLPNGDGTYAVTVGIVRLAEFEGEGGCVDGAVEMVLTDPNGNSMSANFHPSANTRDDGFTLIITESQWSLAETGTEFEHFFLDGGATIELLGEPQG